MPRLGSAREKELGVRCPAEQPDPFSFCLLISPSPDQPCLTVVVSSAISSHQKSLFPRDLWDAHPWEVVCSFSSRCLLMIEERPIHHTSLSKAFCRDVLAACSQCVSFRRYWVFSNSRWSDAEPAMVSDGDKELTGLGQAPQYFHQAWPWPRHFYLDKW